MTVGNAIIIALVVLLASFINRLSGFAFGMIMMCVLPHLLEYIQAVAFCKVLGLFIGAYSFIRYRNAVKWQIIVHFLPTMIIANAVGIYCAKFNPGIDMVRLLGIFFIIYGLYSLFCKRELRIKNTWYNILIFSVLGGFVDGFLGPGGPFTVIYLLSIGLIKYEYFATVQLIFGIEGLFDMILRIANGMIGLFAVKMAIVCIPIFFLGFALGGLIYNKLNAKVLKDIIYGVIIVCGIINLF